MDGLGGRRCVLFKKDGSWDLALCPCAILRQNLVFGFDEIINFVFICVYMYVCDVYIVDTIP